MSLKPSLHPLLSPPPPITSSPVAPPGLMVQWALLQVVWCIQGLWLVIWDEQTGWLPGRHKRTVVPHLPHLLCAALGQWSRFRRTVGSVYHTVICNTAGWEVCFFFLFVNVFKEPCRLPQTSGSISGLCEMRNVADDKRRKQRPSLSTTWEWPILKGMIALFSLESRRQKTLFCVIVPVCIDVWR